MCGRFALGATKAQTEDTFATHIDHEFPPRFNIAPIQPVLIVHAPEVLLIEKSNAPLYESRLVRWGFVPDWVKDFQSWPLTFNIRSETALEKKSFSNAMHYRRVIFPASGFYEWKKVSKSHSVPYYIRHENHELMGLAGLMEKWDSAEGSQIDTAAILTRASEGPLSAIHRRQPIILKREDFNRWLDVRKFYPREVVDLFKTPLPALDISLVNPPQDTVEPQKKALVQEEQGQVKSSHNRLKKNDQLSLL